MWLNTKSTLTQIPESKMLKHSPFSPPQHHIHGYCMDMGRVANFKRVWFWFLLAQAGWNHPCCMYTHTQTHTQTHKHRCTRVCHSPPHTLTHWLADFVMGLSLTHWLCYVTTTETALPPSSPTLPSLSAPPCIHAVFSREALALHSPLSATTPPSSCSGGW